MRPIRCLFLLLLLVTLLPWGSWNLGRFSVPAQAEVTALAEPTEAQSRPHRCRLAVLPGGPCGTDLLPGGAGGLAPQGPFQRAWGQPEGAPVAADWQEAPPRRPPRAV